MFQKNIFKLIIFSLVFFLSAIPAFSQQLLLNPSFESAFTTISPGWYENTWSANFPADVSWHSEDSIVVQGSFSQKLMIRSLGDGGTLFAQQYDFIPGEIYEASVWLHARDSMKISFMLQERVPGYYSPACIIKKIGTGWQQLFIRGGFRSNHSGNSVIEGRFVIQPIDTGILYIDNASLQNITLNYIGTFPVDTAEIPGSFFGMHINKLGVHQTYPPAGIKTIRLWDTGTSWSSIEPYPSALSDSINWNYDTTGNSGFAFRLDYYVDFITSSDPATNILYTMGQTPAWSSGHPSLPPANISDWQNYMSILANRFNGKINSWEIWNEADQSSFYSGSNNELVSLSQSAYQVLKNINPQNNILTPSFTSAQGLASYLYEGGGQYCDIISWHHYPGKKPEESIAEIAGVISVKENYGLNAMEVWNTEGAITLNISDTLSEEEEMGVVSRFLILQLIFGIKNFSWYAWDIYEDVNSRFVQLSYSSSQNQYDSLTKAGLSFRETVRWMSGSRIISSSVNGKTWQVELQRDSGYRAWVVWNSDSSESFNVPSSWNITQVSDLYGNNFSASPAIQIGIMPQLFEGNLPASENEILWITETVIIPDPVYQAGTLRIKSPHKKVFDLIVYNYHGTTVKHLKKVFDGSTIQTGDFVPGLYFYFLLYEGKIESKGRFSVMR